MKICRIATDEDFECNNCLLQRSVGSPCIVGLEFNDPSNSFSQNHSISTYASSTCDVDVQVDRNKVSYEGNTFSADVDSRLDRTKREKAQQECLDGRFVDSIDEAPNKQQCNKLSAAVDVELDQMRVDQPPHQRSNHLMTPVNNICLNQIGSVEDILPSPRFSSSKAQPGIDFKIMVVPETQKFVKNEKQVTCSSWRRKVQPKNHVRRFSTMPANLYGVLDLETNESEDTAQRKTGIVLHGGIETSILCEGVQDGSKKESSQEQHGVEADVNGNSSEEKSEERIFSSLESGIEYDIGKTEQVECWLTASEFKVESLTNDSEFQRSQDASSFCTTLFDIRKAWWLKSWISKWR